MDSRGAILAAVKSTLQKHLDAVSNKDLATLQNTLSPDAQMRLILPSQEIVDSVAGFMDFHRAWFAMPEWTFETQVLNLEVGDHLAMAVVQIICREPSCDGKHDFRSVVCD